LSDGRKTKYIEMFGSFMEPFNCDSTAIRPRCDHSTTYIAAAGLYLCVGSG